MRITKGLFGALALGLALTSAVEAQAANYNLWTCYASPVARLGIGESLTYEGYSRIFGQGSGQGQMARIQAFRQAVNVCQRSTLRRCHSRIEECEVQRITLR